MGRDDLRGPYLNALALVGLTELSRATGRAIRTLTSYRNGERRVTEAAVHELAEYLRERAQRSEAAAAALATLLEKGGEDG